MFGNVKNKPLAAKFIVVLWGVGITLHRHYYKATKTAFKTACNPFIVNEGVSNQVKSIKLKYVRFWPHPEQDGLCIEIHAKIKREKPRNWETYEIYNFINNLRNGYKQAMESCVFIGRAELLTDLHYEPTIVKR